MNVRLSRIPTQIPFLLLFIFLIFSKNANSQCALACTSTQVSLDEFCQAVIIPDMILEGYDSTCVGPLTV